MKKYLTLLKRECWENRFSFFIVPIILAGLSMVLAAFLNVSDKGNGETQFFINKSRAIIDYTFGPSSGATGDGDVVYNGVNHVGAVNEAVFGSAYLFALFMLIAFVSYSLTCLQDERKGNSLLFWNSFPVSHTQAVLVKLFAASALLPAITLVATMMTQVLIIAVLWLRLMGTDTFEHLIWPNLHLIDAWLAHTVNIFVFALGSLSSAGLLLTISATGYRAFILLALTLLILAVVTFFITGDGATVIRFLFTDPLVTSTSMFGHGRTILMAGDLPLSWFSYYADQAINTLQSLSFWLAVGIGVVLVIAAINMRKYRSEI